MKLNLLLFITVALCSTCNCQFTDLCLPHPMREVPILVQIKNAEDFAACGDDRLLALPELASQAEEEIMNNYQPPLTCSLVSLVHTSCESLGRRKQRVLIHYKANLTCGDSCFHLTDNYVKDSDVIGRYYSMVETLLTTSRSKSGAEFNYDGRPIEIFYNRGRKGNVVPVCREPAPLQDDVNKKIPTCKCPSDCPDPCTLPAETGLCRAYFPQFFHNSTSGRCEQFIYGGCGGNQNRFETREECTTACGGDTPTPTSEECPEGMVYDDCGSACPLNCDNKDDSINCVAVCVPGCFCEEGTILLEEGGEVCVAQENCPVKEEECPEGMVYQECGTACPTTCDNKDDVLRPCTLQCVQGCFCETGTVLLEEEGEVCVDPEVCPVKEEECPEGMVYQECGTACPLTCENKDDVIICTEQCVAGCFCPEGYVLKNNSCVLPEDCEATEVDLCTLPPETGPCKALFPRYFYNSTSGQCEDFIYGGCRGNENNFMTVAECEDKCKDDSPMLEECPEGMVYQECGTACPTTCDNKDDVLRPCTLQCVQGCFCEEGTVLLEEEGEVCVDPEVCPVKEEECPEGMVYQECGTACPTTCDNKDDDIICTKQCVQGCFCNGSTVLLEEGGEICVVQENCPVKEEECPEGMVYQECGTACPLTCGNKDDDIICTKQCVKGCFCNGSTVLLEEGGEVCVAQENCPVKEEECPEGMVYDDCGSACPLNCDNKDDSVNCISVCAQGCFCEEGTILLEEGGEVCVAQENCPVKEEECPEGMVYQECGTACPTTCDNKDDDIICTKQCVQGCFCNGSTVLLEEGGEVCVAQESCPVKEEECPEGMVYQECGTACPTTCDNKDDVLRPCTLECVQGCFCSEGTILLEKGKEECVTEDQCTATATVTAPV